MKHVFLLLAASVTSATLVACGSSGSNGSAAAPAAAPTTAAAPSSTGHNAADVTFAQSMIPHHRQAVEMAAMAATRAANPGVKALASQIESAQNPEITTMTGWLTSWGSPTAMPDSGTAGHDMGSMGGMMSDADMAKLKTLSGATFDSEFLTMMTAHHQGAIAMATTELTAGSYPAAKNLARSIKTSQTAEVARMKTLLTQI